MKRLFYLTKNINSTQSISDDLHQAGITDWNFHVLSKQHEGELYRRHIHSADTFQKSGIIYCAERGVCIGLILGIVFALFLSIFPLFDVDLSAMDLFFVIAFGVLSGGWTGGFIGIQIENHQIKRFHNKLEKGYYLIMVDVERSQMHLVQELMKSKHPEAKLNVEDSSVVIPSYQPESIKS